MKDHFYKKYYRVAFASYPFLLGLIVLLTACGKEKIQINWDEQQSPTTESLTAIEFSSALEGHAVGGLNWEKGSYLSTKDGGLTWEQDSISPKKLFGLHLNHNKLYTVGIQGYLLMKEIDGGWLFYNTPFGGIFRDFTINDTNRSIFVAGEAYRFGEVLTMNENFEIIARDSFAQELSAVCYSDENTAHAVGYGTVLISKDQGMTWAYQDVKDDFFKDIMFPTSEVGYIVGSIGNILKTTDGGETWEKLRNGNSIVVSDKSFNAVHFVDAEKGYIVGDKGNFWRTLNGGKDWSVIEDFPDANLMDITYKDGHGYIVSDEGRIFHFED